MGSKSSLSCFPQKPRKRRYCVNPLLRKDCAPMLFFISVKFLEGTYTCPLCAISDSTPFFWIECASIGSVHLVFLLRNANICQSVSIPKFAIDSPRDLLAAPVIYRDGDGRSLNSHTIPVPLSDLEVG